MSTKATVALGMFIGSTLGGYLPILFGGDFFSFSSIFFSGFGGLAGIYLGYKINH